MSDDTPTERFDASANGSPENIGSGDAPTQRLTTAASPAASEQRNNRRLIIILAIIGALLLLAVLIVLLLLLTRSSGTPTALPTQTTSATATSKPTPTTSATPTSTPKPTPTPTPTATVAPPPPPPPPPSTAPSIDSFTISPTTVYCNTHAPGGPFNQYLKMKWATTNASTVAIGSYDPYGDYAGQYYNLPNDGDTTTQGLQITYNCPEASQVWRLEVKGQDGSTIKKEIKILNMGDQS